MPHLYLPSEHTEADLVLAAQVAELVGSADLFVTWTQSAGAHAAPEVAAVVREPAQPFVEALGAIFAALGLLWEAMTRRAAAPSPAQPGAERPALRESLES